jgi:transposase
MRVTYQKSKILARSKTVYIGIDVHKDSWHVTARTEGEEVFHVRIPIQYHALKRLFDRLPACTIKVAYEAGPCGFWLYDKLTQDRIETIVVPPSLIPIESGNKVKTDKRDSRKLTEEERTHREIVRTRRQLVEHRSNIARQIESKLLFHGIKSPFPAKQR